MLAGICQYRERLGAYGELRFKPAPLLERLIGEQQIRIGV